MAELVDALVSDASGVTRGSSSLLSHTNYENKERKKMKRKALLLAPVFALSLASCSSIGVHHEIEEYFVRGFTEADSIQYVNDFKILQLTDLHLSDKDNQDIHFDFMRRVVTQANPNMIVVTGDLFTFASKGTANRLFTFLDSFSIPWTVAFGNHDEQCFFSVDWMTETLSNWGNNCYFKDLQDDDIPGNCNFAINIYKDHQVFKQVIVMDTNRYNFNGYWGYDYVKQSQIDWYKSLVDHTTAQAGGVVKSLMFYHIPLPEIDEAYAAYEKGEATILPGTGTKEEKTCPPEMNSGLFDVILEKGSTQGMYFGHDHINDFGIKYKGVDFVYGIKSTDRLYHNQEKLGGRNIILHEDGSLEYVPINLKY